MYPLIQGHEFSAKIAQVDANNKFGLKEGMLVTGLPYYGCGTCYTCKRGFVQCCPENKTIGALQDGAFRQYFTLPDWRVYDCTGLDAIEAALIEPFVIGRHAAKRPGIKEGDRVLVIGAGTIGAVTAIMAKNLGAEVTICDVVAKKLETVQKDFAIPHILLNDEPNAFVDRTRELTDGDGYDIIMEAVGLPSTFRDSLDAVTVGGKVVSIGVGKVNLDFDFNIIQRKHLEIYGSRNGLEEDFKETIDLAQKGELGDIKKLVTRIDPFTEAAKAYDNADKHGDTVLKSLLKFA
jgi:2-desacetyl-2-hydroxyethyl bacteriochlorophyllide A dehydrogenase